MFLQAAIDAVTKEGGFESSSTATPDATIRGWINEAVQTALARSLYRKAQVDLGPTVVGQDTYDLPDNVVRVRALRVGSSRPYMALQSIEDLWGLQGGDFSVYPGAFFGEFEEDGAVPVTEDTDPQVTVFPAPTAAGLSIPAVCAITLEAEIDATTNAATFVLPLPADLVRPIAVDGAIGIGLERVENRPDLASGFNAKYADAVGELGKRANNRVAGRGAQLRLTRPRVR